MGFIESQNLLKPGYKSVTRRNALAWGGNIGKERIIEYLFKFLIPVHHCCCASLLRLS